MNRKNKMALEAMADAVKSGQETQVEAQSRRLWLQNLGLITASSVVLWNCGKSSDDAAVAATFNPATDASWYAAALALEADAIQTYLAAASLTNVQAATAVIGIAKGFLAHHQEHHAKLSEAITKLKTDYPDAGIAAPGAIPTTAASLDSATTALLTDSTYGVINVVRLAADKELKAAQAYISLIPKFTNIDNALLHGLIGADEAAHYGVLRAALAVVLNDTRDTSLSAGTVVSSAYIDKATATGPA